MATKKSDRPKPAIEADHEPKAAFVAMERAIRAVRLSDVVHINLDIPKASGVVLASEPRLQRLLPDAHAMIRGFDPTLFTDLRKVALSTWYVHVAVARPPVDETAVKELVAECLPLRKSLLTQADALAERGLLDPEKLEEIRVGRGNLDLANDMLGVGAVFRMRWDQIHNKTPVTTEELDKATTLGTKLLVALGVRDAGGAMPDEDGDELRSKAFTLLVNRWDEVRRVVTFLRWHHDDVDEFAPSLYAGARGSRRAAPDAAPPIDGAPVIAPAPASADDAAPEVPVPPPA